MVQLEPVAVLGLALPAGIFAGAQVAGVPLGPVGLAAGAAIGAWLEQGLLARRLAARIGAVGAGFRALAPMFAAAGIAAAAGYGASRALGALPPLPLALGVAALYGVVYFAVGRALGVGEARAFFDSVVARLRRT